MNIIFKHIGLQVIEKDVDSFYVDILGFEFTREFLLSHEESKKIFGKSKKVRILFGSCKELGMELFVSDLHRNPSYNHICIQTENLQEISTAAKQKGYRVFTRRTSSSGTLFISDSNHNTFEIKEKS
jgi:hypothetical protein